MHLAFKRTQQFTFHRAILQSNINCQKEQSNTKPQRNDAAK